MINTLEPDQFLKVLSAIDQVKHKATIPPLDPDEPKFYWIFRNVDYLRWMDNNNCYSGTLWVLGPARSQIHQVSAYVTDAVKPQGNTTSTVLYFFCSTAAGGESIAKLFVRSLVDEIICRLPHLERKKSVIAEFMRVLLDGLLNQEPAPDREARSSLRSDLGEGTPGTVAKKVLEAPEEFYWKALDSVLELGGEGFTIIIDGLDNLEQPKNVFAKKVLTFVSKLQARFPQFRALLTGRASIELKALIGEATCIEYDKERNGLITLHTRIIVNWLMSIECLDSLRFNNTRYGKIAKEHQGSLEWLWAHNQYQSWSASDNSSLLCIQGKPGSGKSTLAKYFTDNLMDREPNARSTSAIVADFFYSNREGEQQTSHYSMLRSILYNILKQDESFFFHFQAEYRKYQELLRHGQVSEWPYESLKGILKGLGDHPRAKRLYLIVDAVDESTDKDRHQIVGLFSELCSGTEGSLSSIVIKSFIATRPIPDLMHHIQNSHHLITLQEETKDDISKLASSILQDQELRFTGDILQEATRYIVEQAQGVFLWVHFVKEELLTYGRTGCSRTDILELLKRLPTELEDLYQLILKNLENGQKRDIRDGLHILQFVLYACRPLTVAELRHALATRALDVETPSNQSFQDSLINNIETRVLHCGGNFIEIRYSKGISDIEKALQTH
jgi:energy-coupling factor transporter ATP-binding protein EcfA2